MGSCVSSSTSEQEHHGERMGGGPSKGCRQRRRRSSSSIMDEEQQQQQQQQQRPNGMGRRSSGHTAAVGPTGVSSCSKFLSGENSEDVVPPQDAADGSPKGAEHTPATTAVSTPKTTSFTATNPLVVRSSATGERRATTSSQHRTTTTTTQKSTTAQQKRQRRDQNGRKVDPSAFVSVAIRGSINPAMLYPSDDDDAADCFERPSVPLAVVDAVAGDAYGTVGRPARETPPVPTSVNPQTLTCWSPSAVTPSALGDSSDVRPFPVDDPPALHGVASSSMFVSGRLSLTAHDYSQQPSDHGPFSPGGKTSATSSDSPPPAGVGRGNVPGSRPPSDTTRQLPTATAETQPSFSASTSLFAQRLSFESQSTRTDSSRRSQGSAMPPSITSTQQGDGGGVDGADDSRVRSIAHSLRGGTGALQRHSPSSAAGAHRGVPQASGAAASRQALHDGDAGEDEDSDSDDVGGRIPAPIPSFCR